MTPASKPVDPELLALLRDERRPLHPMVRRKGCRAPRRPTAAPTRWDRVLVNRPRYNSRLRHPYRRKQRRFTEDSPKFSGMQAFPPHRCGRDQSDHLGPLVRLLHAKTGLRWDAVYSELRARFGRDSTLHDHIWSHLEQMVAIRTRLHEGVVCHVGGLRPGPIRPGHRIQWYVHPTSGVLCRVPASRRPRVR